MSDFNQIQQIKSFLICRCRGLLLTSVALMVLWFSLDRASETSSLKVQYKATLATAARVSGALSTLFVAGSGVGISLDGSFED